MIMSPMIVLMGFQASSYGLSKVEADKALIIMGIFIFLLSLCTLVGTIYHRIMSIFNPLSHHKAPKKNLILHSIRFYRPPHLHHDLHTRNILLPA